ncbi:BRISC and BRCA1-A complex member 2 [Cynara cardunculus var. scolymus]|uniref:BRISC and BRCA1-A complex member 2 n=1 Tax=Cynara cardunculus var. scolymus TaxID=59895 RepID=UPI000D630C2B|nr:BRISC and BRCA1-A complex member 2 [Cynara cardunculus var. scolymus]
MAVDSMPPIVYTQLNYLLTHSPHSIKVEQIWSGSKNPGLLDRFTLAIPFCLDYIKWDVIYNAQFPLLAPDIVFGPEDENFRPYPAGGEGDLKPKNSLSDWNCKDPTRLLSLILELRSLYMAYQKKRVGEVDDERLKFEINTIYSREGIEMYMSSGVDKPEEVKFAVPLLEMDLNKMVAGSTWRHQQKIYLQVIYPVSRKYLAMASAPRLKLVSSPELKAFFSIDEFRLPSWLEGMCMAEYLPTLEEMLESQIRDSISSIEVRRKFITALAIPFGRPVESDPVFCRKATFLACSGVFTFLVHISLPLQFPRQQPALMLQSSQHFHSHPGNAPIKSAILQDYPWSPRWDVVEMADRIFDYLVEECLNFKKHCNEVLVQQR